MYSNKQVQIGGGAMENVKEGGNRKDKEVIKKSMHAFDS